MSASRDARVGGQAGKYLFVACLAVMWWDWITMLRRERKFIWKYKKCLLKVLFLLNRYAVLGFAIVMTVLCFTIFDQNGICDKIFLFEIMGATVVIFLAQAIMSVRVYAIYECRRPMLYFLVGLLGSSLAYMFATASLYSKSQSPPGQGGCFCYSNNTLASTFWIAPLVVDSCLLTLTAMRVVTLQRQGMAGTILETIMRDGLIYFVIIFASNMANTVMMIKLEPAYRSLLSPFAVFITSIMASHIVLNLRSEHETTTHIHYSGSHSTGLSSSPRGKGVSISVTTQETRDPVGTYALPRHTTSGGEKVIPTSPRTPRNRAFDFALPNPSEGTISDLRPIDLEANKMIAHPYNA